MTRYKKTQFILDTIKENHGHIGIPQELYYKPYCGKSTKIKDIDLYADGLITFTIRDAGIIGRTHNCTLKDRTDELIDVIYDEILNNRYL